MTLCGYVKFFDSKKQCGLIQGTTVRNLYFLHRSEILSGEFPTTGTKVVFEAVPDRAHPGKKERAVSVKLIGEADE
jgi:cold shock CspA family protein